MKKRLPHFLLGAAVLALPFVSTAGSVPAKPEPSEISATIDHLIAASWKAKGLKGNPPVSDEVYVRRLYLDVIGRIPTIEETKTFLADPAKEKRSRLVDRLLASEGYVHHFYNFWADILRVNSGQGGGQNVVPAYIDYIKESLRANKPYDQFVRELVTAEGESYDNGAIGYYYRDRGMPLDNLANTVRIFLGTRLECAQCHNHPFDKWTQMDFFHMAAFTYGVTPQGRQNNAYQDVLRTVQKDATMSKQDKQDLQRAFQEIVRPVRNNTNVTYLADKLPQLPHDYKYSDAKPKDKVEAKTMFGLNPEITSPGERLDKFADWLVSPENPRFAKVISNRLWKRIIGVGLVEPVDEYRDETVPANPELMAYLEKQMVTLGYDMKAFLAVLLKTQFYQRTATADDLSAPADYAFTGPVLRRMRAEQIWDSLVTLVNPEPDARNWRQELEKDITMAGQKIMSDVMTNRPPETLLADAKRVASLQKKDQETMQELQKQLVASREAGETDKAKKILQETNELRNNLQKVVYETIYKPAMAGTKINLAEMNLPEGIGDMMMNDPTAIDSNGRPSSKLRQMIDTLERERAEKLVGELGIADEKIRKNLSSYLRGISTNFTRSSNLSSPAPAGHFLREFGQSDREVIENADDQASVPQALTLLNGSTFDTVTNTYSVLSREVTAAPTPMDRLDTIYLSLLARRPTADERVTLMAAELNRGDNVYRDVIYALLNSQEFFFIQ